MPEIPSIAHFCSLFKVALGLPDVEIDQLEASLLKQSNDDIFTASLVDRLVVKLLIGCLPMYASKIHDGNYTLYLKQLLQSKQEEADEEGYQFDFENPFETNDVEDFEDLTVADRVRVIHQLTELRLQCEDIYEKFKDLDPEGLRVEPLGIDSNNVIYWYFYGTRLYKEIKASKKKRPKKKGKEDSDSDGVEEAEGRTAGTPGWSLACSAESQWVELTNRLKKSKKKQDKELYETLAENFLPEISKMFSEKEREEKIKLMLANKRTSSRLVRAREQKEQQFVRAAEEEKQREMERQQEEDRRKQLEKENNLKSREERARLREQKQLYERVIKEHDYYLQTNRKRARGRVVSPDQEGDNQSDGEAESEEQQGEVKTRRRNPALREFQRLLSSEEPSDTHGGRNLRL